MFGKITEINGNSCIVENISHVTHSELMNCHVVFPESDRLVVGEIIKNSNIKYLYYNSFFITHTNIIY